MADILSALAGLLGGSGNLMAAPPAMGGGGMPSAPPLPPMRPDPMALSSAQAPGGASSDGSLMEGLRSLLGGGGGGDNAGGKFNLADILADFGAGAAAPSENTIWGRVGAGIHGATTSSDQRAKGVKADQLAKEDRALKMEDRELRKEDREFDRRMRQAAASRASASSARAARSAQFTELKTVADLMEKINPRLKASDRIAVERLVRDHGKDLETDGLSRDEIMSGMDDYRRQLEAEITGQSAGTATPADVTPAGPGDGASRDQAAEVTSQDDFNALPSGAWFINPADGRVLQKR